MSCNQKHRAIRSSENQTRRSWKQNSDSANVSVAYDQLKTALSELQAEGKEWTNDNVRFRTLRLVGSSASASDSHNLVFTGS